jgi:hypothetical protein
MLQPEVTKLWLCYMLTSTITYGYLSRGKAAVLREHEDGFSKLQNSVEGSESVVPAVRTLLQLSSQVATCS